jgi:hypothetical protein
MEINLGMKRARIERLRDELTTALDALTEIVEVTLYGDVDEYGAKVILGNDDMERPEVPDEAVYVSVEE